MEPRYDCKHFLGDRPCAPAKAGGPGCPGCRDHAPAGPSVALLKLGSLGDVLRTTFLPAALRAALPGATVDWFVHETCLPLFDGHPDVREAIPFDAGALARLQAERHDLLVNLELAKGACAAAALSGAKRKAGFTLREDGRLAPVDRAAEPFFAMCLDDAKKRANGKSYQRLALEIAGIAGEVAPPVYLATPRERSRGAELLAAAGAAPDPARPLVGLNVGSGRRWASKRWPLPRFFELSDRLAAGGFAPVVLVGPDEPELAAASRAHGAPTVGPDLPVREFAGVVSHCRAAVSGDTFALHLALALRVPVVALFGPTSAAEVELFGRGVKIEPERPCRCYYRAACADPEPCMATIGAERVFAALASLPGLRAG